MKSCYFCNRIIKPHEPINWHHPQLKSEGGIEVVPGHERCHVEFHSRNGQFKLWGSRGGKQAATTMRFALNLKNVRTHPAYEPHRQFYLKNYAKAGWSEGV